MLKPILRPVLRSPLRSVFAGGEMVWERWTPEQLFGPDDAGSVIDFSDASSLRQMSNGTGTVSSPNDLIGLAADASPSAAPFVQANAGLRPRWSGIPRELGEELATNGTFATDSGWTKGDGWSILDGAAVKTAGTASVLSQSIAFEAGKTYFITYQITRTAGSLTARLTGGTTVSGGARNYVGSYIEQFVAVTGNAALEFSADASFAGSVSNVSVREVTQFVNMGASFAGGGQRLSTASRSLGGDKATLIVSYQSLSASVASLLEHGGAASTVGSVLLLNSGGWRARAVGSGGDGDKYVQSPESIPSINYFQSNVFAAEFDLAGSSVGEAVSHFSLRGVQPATQTAGTAPGGVLLATAVSTIGASANGVWPFIGTIHRAFIINRKLDEGELARMIRWARKGMAFCAQVGDSTVAMLNSASSLPQALPVHSMVGGMVCGGADISLHGDRIAHQKTRWQALSGKEALNAVFVQVGLNDVKGRVGAGTATASQVIADLQDLIDTIRGDVPAGCKVYASGLIPCKAWLDEAANPESAYSAWQAVNEAIAGDGPTPITGVDARITSHVAALDDGAGNLAPQFDMDGVHENNAARFIIAQAWRAQLEADRLV